MGYLPLWTTDSDQAAFDRHAEIAAHGRCDGKAFRLIREEFGHATTFT